MPGSGLYELRADRDAGRDDLQRQRTDGEHQLQLPCPGDGCGGEPERVLERGERHDAGGRRRAGSRIRVQRRHGNDDGGRLWERDHGHAPRRHLDQQRQVRQRAVI